MYILIGSFLTAFVITYFAIPSIIKIAHEKNLCDEPDERRAHTTRIPTLGGIGVFAGLIFAITYWIPFDTALNPAHKNIQYILCAYIIIFLIGAKDDIIPLSPSKKFIGELVATFLLVYKGGIQLTSLYGILGVYDVPALIGIPLTVLTALVIINAFNLIDGINGLAASLGILVCSVFGAWFFMYERWDLAVLAIAMAGALTAFLQYNITPARIFMGDTGSLLIGITVFILAINFIELNKVWHSKMMVESVPAVAIGILIVPLFDTLRVFTLRATRGKSPFSPDKTHIHHVLLDMGYTHMQATMVLVLVNILFIVLVFFLQHIGTLWLLLVLLGVALLLTLFAFSTAKRVQDAKLRS